jgi:hypothetical protein
MIATAAAKTAGALFAARFFLGLAESVRSLFSIVLFFRFLPRTGFQPNWADLLWGITRDMLQVLSI